MSNIYKRLNYNLIVIMGLLAFLDTRGFTKSSTLVDFDEGMDKDNPYYYSQGLYQRVYISSDESEEKKIISFLRNLYNKNKCIHEKPHSLLKIPRIIHQIWLGSPFPEKFKAYQQKLIELHPEWEYKLWTDERVKNLKLVNQEAFNKARNYGEKSDILRYELLERMGGVYIDVDHIFYTVLDSLHYCYDFYAGIHPLDAGFPYVNNAIIGAVPGHPIMKYCIESIKNKAIKGDIVNRTGPGVFTKAILEKAYEADLINIVLPSTFFSALGYNYQIKNEDELEKIIKPYTFAVHFWAGTWFGGRKDSFCNKPVAKS